MNSKHLGFIVVALAVFASLAGCNSAKGEYESLCHLHERAGATNDTPAAQQQAMSEWLGANIKNAEVQSAIRTMGILRSVERGESLRAFAREGGYDGPCPYADKMTADGLAAAAAHEAAVAAEAAAAAVAAPDAGVETPTP